MKITLRAARVNAGMRQIDAAQAVNVSKQTIINWENGRTYPPMDKMMDLCRYYNVPVASIFIPKKLT